MPWGDWILSIWLKSEEVNEKSKGSATARDMKLAAHHSLQETSFARAMAPPLGYFQAGYIDRNEPRRSLKHQDTWHAQCQEIRSGKAPHYNSTTSYKLKIKCIIDILWLNLMPECELWESCVAISYLPQLSKGKMKNPLPLIPPPPDYPLDDPNH